MDEYTSGGKVLDLNDVFPSRCEVVQQVRSEHADWYYDTPEGYIRYYKTVRGKVVQIYEQRLVAEHVFGPIPKGHIVRHLNNQRADNRAKNLVVLSRSQHAISALDLHPAEWKTCGHCGNRFRVIQQRIKRSTTGKVYCSTECQHIAQRKVQRPSREELEAEMRIVGNWCALGQKYGVSDNAVRKWAKRYGLNLALCDGRRKARPVETYGPENPAFGG